MGPRVVAEETEVSAVENLNVFPTFPVRSLVTIPN